METTTIYWGYTGIMEKNESHYYILMDIVVLEKKVETATIYEG